MRPRAIRNSGSSEDRMTDESMELDLQGFVNGQLDPERRFAVADYLAAHPARAAEVIADMRLTEGLRLACETLDGPPPPELQAAAARLSQTLDRRERLRRALPWAAGVALFAFGWSGHALWTGQEARRAEARMLPLVESALDARAAVEVRQALAGSTARHPVDLQAVVASVGVTLPGLPSDWQVRDAQVVATPERPGVVLVLDTPDMGEVMLFTVASADLGPDAPPSTFDYRGNSVAVFERDSAAYVLVDNSGVAAQISRGADRLARRFN